MDETQPAQSFKYDLFLSYSSKDRSWVRGELLERIEATGLQAFIDFRDFQRGAPSLTECERGVLESRKILLILTPNYLTSGWAEFENIMAQTLDPANASLRLLPLLKVDCKKPLRLGALTHIDFTDGADHDLAWQQLYESLGAPTAPPRPPRPLGRRAGSPASPPFQLPPGASEFFGRAGLVADLATRLRRQKRTDVWGGAGMGKTALAAQALASIVGADPAGLGGSPFPQGIVFLDLYRYKDSLDTAWHDLADAFDDSVDPKLPAAERARRAGAKRRALVILEGAEELGSRLNDFLAVLAPETSQLVLTREEAQTTATRRVKLDDLLQPADALALLRHLAGPAVPEPLLAAVQARLGGHPLALTWAGSQLADATQPPAHFRRELEAQPFTKLTEPGGKPEHTLRWMFDRSVRLLCEGARTVLAAVARVSEPFDETCAAAVGGREADLQRLVQLSFLRLAGDGWQFAHALAAQYARGLPLAGDRLAQLGQWALNRLQAADARCVKEGTAPLGQALAHATALLAHDGEERILAKLANELLYHHEGETVGIRRGRLDFARRAVEAVRHWQDQAATKIQATPSWQRERSVIHERLGDLAVAQGDLAGALRSYTESKTIRERLAASDPANAAWQRDLSVSLDRLGDLAEAQGDLAGALRSFTESKTIAERLAASDPANAQWQRDLSYSCWLIAAKVFQPQERWAEALALMEQSLRISEHLAATDPTIVTWQQDVRADRALVAELREKLRPQ